MDKMPEKPVSMEEAFAAISPESFRGAKVISEPITLTALRRVVAKLKEPEDGHELMLVVCHDDETKQWYVFSMAAHTGPDLQRFLLYVLPAIGRSTPFITKRHLPKGYRTLETLIRQFTDIFGERTILNVQFNRERRFPHLVRGFEKEKES